MALRHTFLQQHMASCSPTSYSTSLRTKAHFTFILSHLCFRCLKQNIQNFHLHNKIMGPRAQTCKRPRHLSYIGARHRSKTHRLYSCSASFCCCASLQSHYAFCYGFVPLCSFLCQRFFCPVFLHLCVVILFLIVVALCLLVVILFCFLIILCVLVDVLCVFLHIFVVVLCFFVAILSLFLVCSVNMSDILLVKTRGVAWRGCGLRP